MNSHTTLTDSSNQDSVDSQSDSRLTVADILSSMANGEVVTSLYTTVEGFSTGIPTRTTPTLTPTTLRNIEQTFIELQSVPPPVSHQHQAGFVPPIINTNCTTPTSQSASYQGTPAIKEEALWYPCSSVSTRATSKHGSSQRINSSSSGVSSTKSGRHMGGRRPNRDEKLSPEEEERRRVRRERNKLAAARCRKRRLDHTNSLLTETEGLEDKKQELEKEIIELQTQRDHLEFILDAHRCLCKNGKNMSNGMTAIRNSESLKDNLLTPTTCLSTPITVSMPTSFAQAEIPRKMARPTSLPISSSFSVPMSTSMKLNTSVSVADATGIPISTPSNGIFNFDALMEGGTGLTPVSSGLTPIIPTCSSQQRNSNNDLSSPDNMNPPKLVSL